MIAVLDLLRFQLLAKPLDRAEHEEPSFAGVAIVMREEFAEPGTPQRN